MEASLATLLQTTQAVAYLVAHLQPLPHLLVVDYLDQLLLPHQVPHLQELLALRLAVVQHLEEVRRLEEAQLPEQGQQRGACLEAQFLPRQVARLPGLVCLATLLVQDLELQLRLREVAYLAIPQILHRLQQPQHQEHRACSVVAPFSARNLLIKLLLPPSLQAPDVCRIFISNL